MIATARQILRIKLSLEFMNLLYRISTLQLYNIYAMGDARSLCRRLLLDIVIANCPVMALSTIFTQYTLEITEFDKIRQNKVYFAVQGHSRSPIFVPIESAYTTSY